MKPLKNQTCPFLLLFFFLIHFVASSFFFLPDSLSLPFLPLNSFLFSPPSLLLLPSHVFSKNCLSSFLFLSISSMSFVSCSFSLKISQRTIGGIGTIAPPHFEEKIVPLWKSWKMFFFCSLNSHWFYFAPPLPFHQQDRATYCKGRKRSQGLMVSFRIERKKFLMEKNNSKNKPKDQVFVWATFHSLLVPSF